MALVKPVLSPVPACPHREVLNLWAEVLLGRRPGRAMDGSTAAELALWVHRVLRSVIGRLAAIFGGGMLEVPSGRIESIA